MDRLQPRRPAPAGGRVAAVLIAGAVLAWPLPRGAPAPSDAGVFVAAGELVRPGPTPAAAQETGPVTLRLDATEGRTSTYRVRSRTHVSPPPMMGMETTAETTMRMRRSVESADGDTLRVAVRIDSFDLDLDSDDESVRSQLRQAEEDARESVLGETFRVAVTRRGEVVAMGDVADGAEAVQQIDRTVRELTFATLPDGPVTVGESWSETRRADAASFGIPMDGEVVTETTSTLSRLLERDGSSVAEIGVETTFGFEPDTARQAAVSVEMSGSSAQTLRFDVDAGRFLSSSGAEDFTVLLSVPGQDSFTLQADSESSAELVED